MTSGFANAFRLDGKTAVVTGAGRGIGRAVAVALAAAGAELILISRTQSQLEEVAAEIASRGGRARAMPLDVTDSAALRNKIAGLGRTGGQNLEYPFVAAVSFAGAPGRPADR